MDWNITISVCAILISVISSVVAPLVTLYISAKDRKFNSLRQDAQAFFHQVELIQNGVISKESEILSASYMLTTHFSDETIRKKIAVVTNYASTLAGIFRAGKTDTEEFFEILRAHTEALNDLIVRIASFLWPRRWREK